MPDCQADSTEHSKPEHSKPQSRSMLERCCASLRNSIRDVARSDSRPSRLLECSRTWKLLFDTSRGSTDFLNLRERLDSMAQNMLFTYGATPFFACAKYQKQFFAEVGGVYFRNLRICHRSCHVRRYDMSKTNTLEYEKDRHVGASRCA